MVWQKRYSAPGAPPGTLVPHPDLPTEVRITAIHYTAETYTEEQVTDLDTYLHARPAQGVLWLNVDGLGQVSILEQLGEHFHLHALSLEDVLNVSQRPKLEDYEGYQFLIMRMAIFQEA